MNHDGLRFGAGVNNCRRPEHVVDAVREAESLGAEIAFISEDISCRDAFELACLCAGKTQSIQLSTGVVNPYIRSPMSLAMATATLDEVSAGRGSLGLGTSTPTLIEEMLGIDHREPVTVMREATEIVRGLLAGESVEYAGRRFVYRNARLDFGPVQDRVPIVFAAMGPRMLRLAGSLADGVLLNVFSSPEYVRWAVERVREGAQEARRDPRDITIAAWLAMYTAASESERLERARQGMARMLSVPRQGELLVERTGFDSSFLAGVRAHYSAYPDRGDLVRAAGYIPDEAVSRMALLGPADAIHVRLQEYRNAGLDVAVMGVGALRALFG